MPDKNSFERHGCHSCKTSQDIQRGLYKRTPWNKVPCAHCKHYDTCSTADDPEQIDEKEAETAQDLLPISLMQSFVAGILSLPPHLRDVVCYRYKGLSYKRIAEIQHISFQAVHRRLEKAVELWPALKDLFLIPESEKD